MILPATFYPLPSTRYPLSAIRHPLPATRHPPPATRWKVPPVIRSVEWANCSSADKLCVSIHIIIAQLLEWF